MFRRMIRDILLLVNCILSFFIGYAQIGGGYAYSFLDMPATARITAMGGNLISIRDGDPGQASDNPSLLNQEMNKTCVLSYTSYFSGINNGFASYTSSRKFGVLNAAVKYLDYGNFKEMDASSNELGTFSANELVLIGGYGRQIDSSFSVGANLKFIYSNLYLYNTGGAAIDLSASYELKRSMFLVTMLVKNAGHQFFPFEKGQPEPLPFDVQFGISKRFKKMPFHFSLVAQNLARGRLTYPVVETVNTNPGLGDEGNNRNLESNAENFFRHFVLGSEFIPSKNFSIQIAYNFQRRREMTFDAKPGTVGFSWGFGLKISKFHINYARSAYHLAGSPNHFTILTRFSDWNKS